MAGFVRCQTFVTDAAKARCEPEIARCCRCHECRLLVPGCYIATHPLSTVAGQARHEPLHWVASPNYVDDPNTPLSLVLFPSGCVCRDITLEALKQIDRPWHVAYSTRSIGLMEKAMLESSAVSDMEASIIPPSLKIIDGQPGFPALPKVVISVHQSNTSEPHVLLVADNLLAKLGHMVKQRASSDSFIGAQPTLAIHSSMKHYTC